jgi:hypothetical protein
MHCLAADLCDLSELCEPMHHPQTDMSPSSRLNRLDQRLSPKQPQSALGVGSGSIGNRGLLGSSTCIWHWQCVRVGDFAISRPAAFGIHRPVRREYECCSRTCFLWGELQLIFDVLSASLRWVSTTSSLRAVHAPTATLYLWTHSPNNAPDRSKCYIGMQCLLAGRRQKRPFSLPHRLTAWAEIFNRQGRPVFTMPVFETVCRLQ